MLKNSIKAFFSFVFVLVTAASWCVCLKSTTGTDLFNSNEYNPVLELLQNSPDLKHKEHFDALKGINEMYRSSYFSTAIYIAPGWFLGLNKTIGAGTRYFIFNEMMQLIMGNMPTAQAYITHPSSDVKLVLVKIDSLLKNRTPVKRYFGSAMGDDYYFFSNYKNSLGGLPAGYFPPVPPSPALSSLSPVIPFSLRFDGERETLRFTEYPKPITMKPNYRALRPLEGSLMQGFFYGEDTGMPIFKKSGNSGDPFNQYKLAAIAKPDRGESLFLTAHYLGTPIVSNWIANVITQDALEVSSGAAATTTASTNNNTRETMGASTSTTTSSNNNKQKIEDLNFETEMAEKLGLTLKGGDGYPISPFCLITTQARQVGAVARRSVIKDWSKPNQAVNYEQLSVRKAYHLPNDLALAYLQKPLLNVKFNLFDSKRHPESIEIELYHMYVSKKAEDFAKRYLEYHLYNHPANDNVTFPNSLIKRLVAESSKTVGDGLAACIEKMKIGSKLFEASKAHRAKGLPKETDPLLVFWNNEVDKTPLPDVDSTFTEITMPLAMKVTSYKEELERLNFTPTFIHNVDKALTDYRNNLNAISNLMIAEAIDAAPTPVRSY